MRIDCGYDSIYYHNVNHFLDNMKSWTSTYGIRLPHEWRFINLLYKYELKKDKDVAKQFVMYAIQTSEYKWSTVNPSLHEKIITSKKDKDLFNYIDQRLFDMFLIESALRSMTFDIYCRMQCDNPKDVLLKDDSFYRAMDFGDVVTEFMIRHLRYSLIGNSDQKAIITSMSDCGKRFEKYLEQGYSLQRLARTQYIRLSDEERSFYPELTGYFKFLPVLPTNSPYKVDEVIETSLDVKRYMKVID